MTRGARRSREDAGLSSAVLLVAVVPFLVTVFFACLLAGVRTYATIRAGIAAEAAARAGAAGADPESAALGSLSRRLAQDARVRVVGDRVFVRVNALDPSQWGRTLAQVELSAPVSAGGTP